MKDIPEDVIRIAKEALGEQWCAELGGTRGWLLRRDCIARAIMAERERCANIANAEAERRTDNYDEYPAARVHDAVVTARRIQFAITGEPTFWLTDAIRAELLTPPSSAASSSPERQTSEQERDLRQRSYSADGA